MHLRYGTLPPWVLGCAWRPALRTLLGHGSGGGAKGLAGPGNDLSRQWYWFGLRFTLDSP